MTEGVFDITTGKPVTDDEPVNAHEHARISLHEEFDSNGFDYLHDSDGNTISER